ncbi:unnamed protein product [Cladocopium goreaui]|uniref:Pentatricopeptide repeat-containing protein At1g12300, mitochondrial n=1 Tax=Cladocopium goreaui TaxID=2562237 RepID=A0A9P1FSU1_9DINO|nr:unnamed protein product [Cladocopium goreaui]
MLQEGYGHCLSGFHALIMAKTRWQSAVAVLEDMRICSIPPSSVSFSLIVGSCRVADEWRWPLAMLGLDPESLWGSVAGACQQAAQWRWSAWLLEKHGEDQLTESTFNLALSICKVARQWQRALDLVYAHPGRPGDFALASTIKACEARWQRCLTLLERQLDVGPIGPVVITTAISACEKAKKWQAALHLARCVEDCVALSSVMSACVQGSEWQRALCLFSRAGNIDAVTWSVAASACDRGSSWELAFHLFREMTTWGQVNPNVVVYGALLRSSRWREQLSLLDHMMGRQIELNGTCISEVLSSFSAASQLAGACSLQPILLRQTLRSLSPRSSSRTQIESVNLGALLHDMSCWTRASATMYRRSMVMPLRPQLLNRCRLDVGLEKVATMAGGFMRLEVRLARWVAVVSLLAGPWFSYLAGWVPECCEAGEVGWYSSSARSGASPLSLEDSEQPDVDCRLDRINRIKVLPPTNSVNLHSSVLSADAKRSVGTAFHRQGLNGFHGHGRKERGSFKKTNPFWFFKPVWARNLRRIRINGHLLAPSSATTSWPSKGKDPRRPLSLNSNDVRPQKKAQAGTLRTLWKLLTVQELAVPSDQPRPLRWKLKDIFGALGPSWNRWQDVLSFRQTLENQSDGSAVMLSSVMVNILSNMAFAGMNFIQGSNGKDLTFLDQCQLPLQLYTHQPLECDSTPSSRRADCTFQIPNYLESLKLMNLADYVASWKAASLFSSFKELYTAEEAPSWEDKHGQSAVLQMAAEGLETAQATGVHPADLAADVRSGFRFAFDLEGILAMLQEGFYWDTFSQMKYANNGAFGAAVVEDQADGDVLGFLMMKSQLAMHLTEKDGLLVADLADLEQYKALPGFAPLGGKATFQWKDGKLTTVQLQYKGKTYDAVNKAEPAETTQFQHSVLEGWNFAEKAIIASLLAKTQLLIHVKTIHMELAPTLQAVTIDSLKGFKEHPLRQFLEPFTTRNIQATNNNLKIWFEFRGAEFGLAPLSVEDVESAFSWALGEQLSSWMT